MRYLAELGAKVTVTDLRPADQLQSSLDALKFVSLEGLFCDGHPPEAFDGAELLIVNPAVRPNNQIVQRCRDAGAMVASELELFLSANPAFVVAVTGTNGKSTTASLIAHLLQPTLQRANRNVWLGGNIGASLLPSLPKITAADIVVLEVSSFQLEYLRESGFAPDVAVITNLSPNHIDWHENIENYKSAKQVLLQRQLMSQFAILPASDEAQPEWRVRARAMQFAESDTSEDGAFWEDGSLVLRNGAKEDAIRLQIPRQLSGRHNKRNLAAAACAAWVAGADPDDFQRQLDCFQPLPHRLQLVCEGRGIRFYNDSNSTTPESTIAALKTVTGNVVLIAGGADKGADFREMCQTIGERCVAAVFIGDTAKTLNGVVQTELAEGQQLPTAIATDFRDAFARAVALVPERGIVLLSPGCASFGWFRDYRDRGEQFEQMARHWIQD